MASPFQTKQMPLGRLFSGTRHFAFPAFQRPYRWSVDEAMTLLDDVAAAATRKDAGYFLGNLVLTEDKSGAYFVIDGRQRLTTLFILICVLRDLEDDMNRKAGLHRLVYGKTKSGEKNWRIAFPETERPFIEAVIARPKKESINISDHYRFTERLEAMLDVASSFRKRLAAPYSETGLPRREDLTDYLLTQCEVIVLTANDSASGLRLFQVLNNRGLQLSEADLIKPDLLQVLSAEDAAHAARMWENMEDQLGSENLDFLLRAMVFIQTGDWVAAGRDFTEPLKAIMLSRGPEVFHFEDLPKYGDAFAKLHWADIEFTSQKRNPNTLITGLYSLGRTMGEWKEFLPVAMELLVRFEEDEDKLLAHIAALDKCFFVWFINETPEHARRKISFKTIESLRGGLDVLGENGALNPPQKEFTKALEKLARPFPRLFQRGALIRRIELALAMKEGRQAPQYLDQASAEHILPKNPRPGSQWLIDFTRRDMRDCLDLLGNGVPLSRELDRKVGNKDFNQKKTLYLREGADRYFLSVRDVCKHDHWTPKDIQERTEGLVELLSEAWR